MSYDCEVKEQTTHFTLYMRRKTPVQNLGQITGKVYESLMAFLDAMHEKPSGPPYILYHNMDMKNLDCEIGFPVAKQIAGKGDIHAGIIAASTIATCVYTGPYDGIGPAYEELNKWIAEHHFQVTGAAYEEYLNDPTETPQSKLQTRIVFPVKAA